MALSLDEIDAWDTGSLEEFSRQLERRFRTLAELGDSVADASRIPDWTGLGADAAHARFTRMASDISDQAATVGAVSELVSSLTDQVRTFKAVIDDARARAAEFGLEVTGSGVVIDGPAAGASESAAAGFGGPLAVAAARATKEAARAEITAQVQALLIVAADVEADTTAVLSRAANGGFTGDGMSAEAAGDKGQKEADGMFAAPPPPDDVHVQQYYLDALSSDQRDEIIRKRPEWLANAYGVDPVVRSQAAESYLDKLQRDVAAERTPLLRELRDLEDSRPVGPGGPAVRDGAIRELEMKLEPLNNQLADLERIESVIGDDPNVHLLGLRAHDNGIGAVVARGDITAADHVTVNVPGTGTTARDGLEGQLLTLTRLEDKMVTRLAVEGREHETIATVAYVNTEFPPTLPEARHAHYADTAAPDLAGVLNGINATSSEGANLTVLGHSYGSLIASEALQAGGDVDNVVFYGSPGLETSGERFDADSLGVNPQNRYVMHAAREPIQVAHLADPFGGLPQNDPGLIRLGTSAQAGQGLVSSIGHSDYHLPESTSLHNFAAVSVGSPDTTIAYDPEKFDDDNYHQVLGVNLVPKWPF